MANILFFLGAGEPHYSSAKSLAYAFRLLGHEVCTMGPGYFDRYEADVLMPDRPHIEYYSPDEILERAPWSPSLIVNCEPHAFLRGQGPPEIPIVFVATDPHRAGSLYHAVLSQGSYTHFFCGQKHYLPLFNDLPCRTYYLPVAFDPRRFKSSDLGVPACDISFCGQTGLSAHYYSERDEVGSYMVKTSPVFPTDVGKYEFRANPSFDYAERAEFLLRLMRDFNVRIYEPFYDDRYIAALQKGAIGFQRSLLYDVSIRVYEIMAAGRFLVMDRIPNLDEWFGDEVNNDLPCALYESFYRPFYDNFNLEYRQVYNLVKYYLDHDTERDYLAARAHAMVWKEHRWQDRTKTLLEIVLN